MKTWIISGGGASAWEWENTSNVVKFDGVAAADAFVAERRAAGDRVVDDRGEPGGNVWD